MKRLLILLLFFQFTFLKGQEALYVSAKNGLIVREEPNKNSKRLGKLSYAEKIVHYESTGRFDEIIDNRKVIKGEWYHIIGNDVLSNEIEGYVFNAFLTSTVLKKEISYFEFKSESSDYKLDDFFHIYAYKLDSLKVIVSNLDSKDGKLVKQPNSYNADGVRLLVLDSLNKVIYQSEGMGDLYVYEPYFFKNYRNNKIIIICVAGFEYYRGSDAYLIEKENIRYLGNLYIDSVDDEDNMDKNIIDMIKIKEQNEKIIFSFTPDSLYLKSGSSDDMRIKNNNVRYEYQNGSFTLINKGNR